MPIYEYRCPDCKQIFEEWQRDYEEHEVMCPVCGSKAERLISHTSFILKGTGWYATDYSQARSGTSGKGGNGAKKKETFSDSRTKEEAKYGGATAEGSSS